VDKRHYSIDVSEVRDILEMLKAKGWTLAAVADAVGVPPNTVRKWHAGMRNPANATIVLEALRRLLVRKRVPKQRRYTKSPLG